MRIRSTKPEFWRSKLIASVSWEARLILKALESYVDDNGVGEDDVNVLTGDCFLHDLIREPSRTLARVSEAISDLHQAGLVWRYEANGRNLLYVSFWETIQRIDKAQAGRNPRPDGTFNYKDSIIRESVATSREESRGLAPGTGEQGNRGTEEQGIRGTEDQILLSDSDESNADGELLSDDWVPTQKHFDHATSLGLDPQYQLGRFRDHAKRNQRRMKNWNTAFTNWLKKGAELAQQRQVSGQQGYQQPQRQTAVDKARALAAGMSFGGKEIES